MELLYSAGNYHIAVSAFSLEQLYLNKNNLNRIYYPNNDTIHELVSAHESHEESYLPFQNLCCLLLGNSKKLPTSSHVSFVVYFLIFAFSLHASGNNMIEDLASIDSLDSFPKLMVKFILWTSLKFSNLLDIVSWVNNSNLNIYDSHEFLGSLGKNIYTDGRSFIWIKS